MSTFGAMKDNEPIKLTCEQQIKHTTTSHELYILRRVANKNTVKMGTKKKTIPFCEGCHPNPLLQVPPQKINSNHVRVIGLLNLGVNDPPLPFQLVMPMSSWWKHALAF